MRVPTSYQFSWPRFCVAFLIAVAASSKAAAQADGTNATLSGTAETSPEAPVTSTTATSPEVPVTSTTATTIVLGETKTSLASDFGITPSSSHADRNGFTSRTNGLPEATSPEDTTHVTMEAGTTRQETTTTILPATATVVLAEATPTTATLEEATTTILPETITTPAETTTALAEATTVLAETATTLPETTTPVTGTQTSSVNTVTTAQLPTASEKAKGTPPQPPTTPANTPPVTSTASTSSEQTTPATFTPRRNATTPKRRVGGSVMKSTPSTRRLVLVLRGNCSRENLMGDLEQAFRKLSSVENVSVTEIHCSTLLDVNVTLSAGELQLKQLLKNLSLTRNLPVGDEASAAHRFVLTDFSVREDVANDGATSVRPRWVPTDEELIIYIAVGVLFAIVLIIAFVVCTIKCCRRQPTKTLDFLETPHLNLRLEDYTLTRIPRPHTIYADHLRTPTSENGPTPHYGGPGLVQPFDTCIVPLEDAAPPRRPSRRIKEDATNQHLRTFGQSQASPSPSRTPGPRQRRVDDVDDDSESRRSKSLSSSRERLAQQRKTGPHGVDNPMYVTESVYGRKAKG